MLVNFFHHLISILKISTVRNGRLVQWQRHGHRCARTAVRFPGRSNKTACSQSLTIAAKVFLEFRPRLQAGNMRPETRYTLRGDTTSIMKIRLLQVTKLDKKCDKITIGIRPT